MIDWLKQILESGITSWLALPLAALAGILASATSCCNAGVLGAVAGYSGTDPARTRRNSMLAGFYFIVGAAAALMALGAVTGFFGQLVVQSVGRYWKALSALVLVFFGLIQLKWLSFKWHDFRFKTDRAISGQCVLPDLWPVGGGGATSCDFTCNPILSAMLGLIFLHGSAVWGTLILLGFSIGYALLPAGLPVGLGFGFKAVSGRMGRAIQVAQTIAGAGLILVGFYLLLSL